MPATRSWRWMSPAPRCSRTWACSSALAALLLAAASARAAASDADCLACHGEKELRSEAGASLFVDAAQAPEERSRGARLRRLPRRHDGRPARGPGSEGPLLQLPRGRPGDARAERPRPEERWRRGAGLHDLPRQDSRVPAARRARLAGREAQPARDLRRLPREPGVPGEARARAGAADRGLRPERPRPRARERQREGRLLLRLPRRTRRRQGEGRRVAHQPLERALDLRAVPQGGRDRLRGQHPRPGGRPRPRRSARLHRLPWRARDPGARGARLAREPRARVERHLRSLPRRRAAGLEVQPAAGQGPRLRGQLPRPGGTRRLAKRRQLRLLPRRPQHPAGERPALDGSCRQPGQDLRRLPRRSRRALRDRPGPRHERHPQRARRWCASCASPTSR